MKSSGDQKVPRLFEVHEMLHKELGRLNVIYSNFDSKMVISTVHNTGPGNDVFSLNI